MSAMLTPSINIFPFAASKILKIPKAREDFPAPVLPTIPTWKQRFHSEFMDGIILQFKQFKWSKIKNITQDKSPSPFHEYAR